MRSKLELRSLILLLVLLPFSAAAQSQPATSPPAAPSAEQTLKPEQLDAIVAPIALYPDNLLAQVMMAATYPLEVVQAARWAEANKELKGDALKQAIEKLTWDDSVKSLIATPSVLAMMSTKLDWTQKLGDAVLAQETDVMDAVQRLRVRAQGTDKLKSSKEQNVTVRQEGGKQVVAIQSTNPETVYVPYYDPAVVYGTWPYPEYPPDYWYPDDYWFPGGVIATGIAFGTGYALWRWWDNNHWRGHIDWNKRDIDVRRNNVVQNWQHNPQHRRGVAYNNPKVRQQFAGATGRPGDRAKAGDRTKQVSQVKRPAQGNKQAKAREPPGARGLLKERHKARSRRRTGEGRPGSLRRQSDPTRRTAQVRRDAPVSNARAVRSSARGTLHACSVRAIRRRGAMCREATAAASAVVGAALVVVAFVVAGVAVDAGLTFGSNMTSHCWAGSRMALDGIASPIAAARVSTSV